MRTLGSARDADDRRRRGRRARPAALAPAAAAGGRGRRAGGRRARRRSARWRRRRPAPTARSSSRCRRSGSSSSAPTPRCASRRSGTRLPHAGRALLRPRPHRDAADRRRDLAAAGLRQRPARRRRSSSPTTSSWRCRRREITCAIECAGNGRIVLRHPAGDAGAGLAVEARGDRRGPLARRAAARPARARRASASTTPST